MPTLDEVVPRAIAARRAGHARIRIEIPAKPGFTQFHVWLFRPQDNISPDAPPIQRERRKKYGGGVLGRVVGRTYTSDRDRDGNDVMRVDALLVDVECASVVEAMRAEVERRAKEAREDPYSMRVNQMTRPGRFSIGR